MAKKSRKKKGNAIHACAVSLGRRGGKKTYSLGKGIFADVIIRRKRRAVKKKKKTAKRKRTKRS